MARERPITAPGVIVRRESAGHYLARLPNGHEVVAYRTRARPGAPEDPDAAFAEGDLVWLELAPFDFSTAAIRGRRVVVAPEARPR